MQEELLPDSTCGLQPIVAETTSVEPRQSCDVGQSPHGQVSVTKMRVILGLLARVVVPAVLGVYYAVLRLSSQQTWQLRGLRAHLNGHVLSTVLAVAANTISMSLSSVQVLKPANTIDPLLRAIRIRRKENPRVIALPEAETAYEPEKSVSCRVLAEPPPGVPIRADVIFIHGLHGSLVNTWKQGVWGAGERRVPLERQTRTTNVSPSRPLKRSITFSTPPMSHTSKKARKHSKSSLNLCSTNDNLEMESANICAELNTLKNNCDNESDPIVVSPSDNMVDCKLGSEKKLAAYSPCWPGDWLPLDCPGVRVIALNYTTDPYLWRPVWVRKRNRTNLFERAQEMAGFLKNLNVGQDHPIIWVGHSKGGLFVKQMIVDAWEQGQPEENPLCHSTKGILFYSVPHRGAPLADFNLPLLRQSVELTEIQKDCGIVLELHRRFLRLYHSGILKAKVFSFIETALTLMSVLYLRIVGIDSADPGIGEICGVHLDHRDICKPNSRQCFLYTELTKLIDQVS